MTKKEENFKEPEIINSVPARQDSSLAQPNILGGTLWNARRKRRIAEENTANVQAHSALGQALNTLAKVQQEYEDLPITLAADTDERMLRKRETENALRDAERKTLTAALDDEIAQKERLLKIADLEARLASTNAPPKQKSEDEKVRADFDRHFGRENAIRAEAQRRIEEVLRRSGGEVTPKVALEIKNINDYAQRKIDDL